MIYFENFLENEERGRGNGLMRDMKQKRLRCIIEPPTNFLINGVNGDASLDVPFTYSKMHLRIKFWHNRVPLQLDMKNDLKNMRLKMHLWTLGAVMTFLGGGGASIKMERTIS